MGRTAEKPKYHVFTFRADDETARLIREAAASCQSVSDFLSEAAIDRAMAVIIDRKRKELGA